MPEAFKKYVLMHKEVAVAGVELDEATGLITAVYDVSNAAHLPLGVSVRKGIADRAACPTNTGFVQRTAACVGKRSISLKIPFPAM